LGMFITFLNLHSFLASHDSEGLSSTSDGSSHSRRFGRRCSCSCRGLRWAGHCEPREKGVNPHISSLLSVSNLANAIELVSLGATACRLLPGSD
jgi:hypothetical protein